MTSGAGGGRGVLDGAFALLEALNARGGQAGLSELVRGTGLPRTTTYRLLEQLVELGAVERSSRRYRIGSRVFRLGQSWEPELRKFARHWLPVLSTRMAASLVLAVSREDRVLVVSGATPAGSQVGSEVRMWPGRTLPSGTAASRLLAAYEHGGGKGGAAIRTNGFAVETRSVLAVFGSVAVPVRSPDGRVAATLAAVVPVGRDPLSSVAGLMSTARLFGGVLAAAS